LQLPHFQGRFGVTSNAGSAISASYAASVSLVQWLDFCGHSKQYFNDLASTWAPVQNLANLDEWTTPIFLRSNTTSFLQSLDVMNGQLMGQLLPQQIRKSRV